MYISLNSTIFYCIVDFYDNVKTTFLNGCNEISFLSQFIKGKNGEIPYADELAEKEENNPPPIYRKGKLDLRTNLKKIPSLQAEAH